MYIKKIIPIIFIFLLLPFCYLFAQTDSSLSKKMKGKILLQVEKNGEAWYVHPSTFKKIYLGRPEDAYEVMRGQGVGIVNIDLYKIPIGISEYTADKDDDGLSDYLELAIGLNPDNSDTDGDGYSDKDELLNGHSPWGVGKQNIDNIFADKQKGKIFLQVEKNGEAWYVNPSDGKRYFLGKPVDAFNVMRRLGQGIKNIDIEKIESAKNQIIKETGKLIKIENPENNSQALLFKGFNSDDFNGKLKVVASTSGLKFSSADCNGKLDDNLLITWTNKILDARWNGAKLVVDTLANLNCCPQSIVGAHKIEGETIILSVAQKFGEFACGCDCDYKLRYEIGGLDKKKYTIKFATDFIDLNNDNVISDMCDGKRNDECYFSLYNTGSKNTVKEEGVYKGEIQVLFANPEDEKMANKYPKFLEYYKKYNSYPYDQSPHECIQLEYSPKNSYLGIRESHDCKFNSESYLNSFNFSGGGWGEGGKSTEEIVVNYINKVEEAYGENSLYSDIKKRTELNILEIAPNYKSFLFEYGNEYYDYSNLGIDFSDYERDYRFYKNGEMLRDYPDAKNVDKKTIVEMIELINKIAETIRDQKDFLFINSTNLRVDIDLTENKALFKTTIPYNEKFDDKRYTLIHGFKIPITGSRVHDFSLNLKTWKLEIIKK